MISYEDIVSNPGFWIPACAGTTLGLSQRHLEYGEDRRGRNHGMKQLGEQQQRQPQRADRVIDDHFLQTEHRVVERGCEEQHEDHRSEEHTSELQSLMRTSSAVICLTKKKDSTQVSRPETTSQIIFNQ